MKLGFFFTVILNHLALLLIGETGVEGGGLTPRKGGASY